MTIRDVIETIFVSKGASGVRAEMAANAKGAAALSANLDRLGRFSAATGAASALAAGVVKATAAAGEVERVQAGLESTLGTAEKARTLLGQIQDFSATTPFDFADTAKASQQLLAYGVASEKLLPILKGIGNATAAAGGSTEEFVGALRAIGQIQTKGRLQGDELLQLSERGIPATRILQRELGLTADQMARIGEQRLDAEQVINALVEGANKDFGNAMAHQAQTLTGSLANLRDAAFQFSAAMGAPFVGPVGFAARMLGGFANAVRAVPGLAAALGVAMAAAAIAMAVYAVKVGIAIVRTGVLAKEVLGLAGAYLKLAGSAGTAGAAVGTVGGLPAHMAVARLGGASAATTGAGAAGSAGLLAGLRGSKGAAFLGRAARSGGGIGLGAALAGGGLEWAGSSLPEGHAAKPWYHGAGTILGAAGTGAAVGSLAGPWGAVAGGVIGAGVGAGSLLGEGANKEQSEMDRLIKAVEENTRAQQTTAARLGDLGAKAAGSRIGGNAAASEFLDGSSLLRAARRAWVDG
jgi:tape measure domain-containing protein